MRPGVEAATRADECAGSDGDETGVDEGGVEIYEGAWGDAQVGAVVCVEGWLGGRSLVSQLRWGWLGETGE